MGKDNSAAAKDPNSEPLVELNMDISQLKGYMDNIIAVVNQHAKLLHTLNSEI